MPILYSVVSRGSTVLAKHACCAGNFPEVTEQIILRIPPHDEKLTYSHGSYLFHYICENQVIYMCVTDDVSYRIFHNCNQISKYVYLKSYLHCNLKFSRTLKDPGLFSI